jgi:hypothetical protein
MGSDSQRGFSHNFDRSDLPHGSRHLGLITCNGKTYSAVAVVTKEGATSTLQNRVRFTHVEAIAQVPVARLLALLPARVRPHAVSRSLSLGIAAFPPQTAEHVLAAALSILPSLAESLRRLLRHVLGSRAFKIDSGSAWNVVAQEKDAVDLALRIAGMPTASFAEEIARDDRPRPALELLGGLAVEDRQIEADAEAFGGYRLLERDIRGKRVFWDDRGQARVVVINANRHALERTLGVDLIVHYERFDSLLLVQYKRLTPSLIRFRRESPGGGSRLFRYYPARDRSYKKELARIRAVRNLLQAAPCSHWRDYRLSDDPFYFKFCRADTINPDAMGMVGGLFLLAADVEHFLASSLSAGSRGGHSIGFDNISRRFPNSLFVSLAQGGWIGSRGWATTTIARYIESALRGRRSLLLASVGTSDEGVADEPDIHPR